MKEIFTNDDVLQALRTWSEFGEQMHDAGHQKGYFSGDGWAARVLRSHLDALEHGSTPKMLVAQQAEDPGLWFVALTAPEAYLQVALRELHAAVENSTGYVPEPKSNGDEETQSKLRAAIREAFEYGVCVKARYTTRGDKWRLKHADAIKIATAHDSPRDISK